MGDWLIIHLIQKNKINWVNVIMENMLKKKRFDFYKYPFVVLISRILDHFKVEVNDEITYFVESELELKNKVLK